MEASEETLIDAQGEGQISWINVLAPKRKNTLEVK